MKRRLVLLAVLVAAIATCVSLWVNEGPLWRWVMLERVPLHFTLGNDHLVGWQSVKRWGENAGELHGRVLWYKSGGLKAVEAEDSDEYLTVTGWYKDGAVEFQMRGHLPDDVETRTSPPWLWGVKNQTEPSAPSWNEGEGN